MHRRKEVIERCASLASRVQGGVGRWIASRSTAFPVASADLAIVPDVRSTEAPPTPAIRDGLDVFVRVSAETESGRTARRLAAATRIGSVAPVPDAVCRDGRLLAGPVEVRESKALNKLQGNHARTKEAALFAPSRCRVRTPGWQIRSAPAVLTATARLVHMPQIRMAEPTDTLSVRDCEGYLREAQVQRGLDDRAELLAVFRRVPIEGVARLRFIEEKRLLFFTMSPGGRGGTCRVHDLAAVRDAGGSTHLVPHRTRFRTLVLG